jgi:hypothetical protein
MKAFISQPMKNKTREEILIERNDAVEILEAAGYEVIDSVFTDYAQIHSPLECLAHSLETLAKADLAVFLPGWENARGCGVEYLCCLRYGIPVVIGLENIAYRVTNAKNNESRK